MIAAAGIALALSALTSALPYATQAFAASASGGSAITEGSCSTGVLASLSASLSTSCGPNFSGSAAGDLAFCRGLNGASSFAILGTCSASY